MEAGRLRHRVTIQTPVTVQDQHGDPVVSWAVFADKVPAEIAPVSGKEFLAGQGIAAQVIARITIRWRPGLSPDMRVRHEREPGSPPIVDLYNIAAALQDNETGRDHITLMCSRGVNDG